MKGYKGFDKDLKCRNKQYAIGKEEVEETASLCNKGLHFCENPHNVFSYYPAGNGNRFCEVEADEVSDERENDSKRVAKRLTVEAEVNVFHICKIAVSTFFENFGFKKKIDSADTNNAGNYGAANAGNYGAANAGYQGAANAGYQGAANAGNYGAANAGNYGAANAGYQGAANAGNYGAANAGYQGAANAGNYGAANAGNYGAASVKGNGVAISSTGGKVKGGKGSVLVLVNRNDNGNIIDFASAIVDGEVILPDTWYRLEEGKFVQVEENNH
ncbi:MAG: hypothetical protein LBJ63_06285 [Prevotellaceae bacterium]|jgi:hypothetical protein|nr:hypothetical protein [Prevotellaceae bacterium]